MSEVRRSEFSDLGLTSNLNRQTSVLRSMISLGRKDFPSPRGELADALDDALHRFVEKAGQIVELRSRVFPLVDEIRVNLDGAIIDFSLPPVAEAEGKTSQAFETSLVTISGRRISAGGVPLNLRMEMRDVTFDKGSAVDGDAVLILRRAGEGQLVLSASQLQLEEAFARIVGAKARLYG